MVLTLKYKDFKEKKKADVIAFFVVVLMLKFKDFKKKKKAVVIALTSWF